MHFKAVRENSFTIHIPFFLSPDVQSTEE